MPFNTDTDLVDVDGVNESAQRMVSLLRNLKISLVSIRASVIASDYLPLLEFPRSISHMQREVDNLVAENIAIAVRDNIAARYAFAGFQASDITDFVSALGSLRTDIRNNSNLFLPSHDDGDQIQFITPVSNGVRNVIVSRINAALAIVNA